jgi:hypothetical protein
MIKYLVFKNDRASGKSNVPGSPEDVACDIARVVEMDGNTKYSFIAHAEGSPEATFATLQGMPRYALELDQSKIDAWISDAEPMLAKILSVHDVIDNAYGDILSAVDDLDTELQDSAVCNSLDLMDDMNIDHGFEAISRPSEYEFSEHIAEYFDVQVFEYHPSGSP